MTISSTGKDMLVQFLTDDYLVWNGFRAYFHYVTVESNCENWLDRTASLLKSPDYPTIDCSWVITAPSIDSTIIIQFASFEVEYICFQKFYRYSSLNKTLEFLQLGNVNDNVYLKIYNGGSEKDELLKSVTGNSIPSPVKSLGNQVFVIFNTDGSAVGKGFSAIITFGT